MKKLLCFLAIIFLISACKKQLLDGNNQQPYDKLSPATAFNSESDLQLYVNSFYSILPAGDDITHGDAMTDITARNLPPSYLMQGAYSSQTSGGWSWSALRNVNYFLNYAPTAAKKAGVRDEAINNFTGIARFFRAWFYFDKVVRFGDVPWYNKPLDPSDSALYKPRDSRTLVMDSVLADLDFASNNINNTKD